MVGISRWICYGRDGIQGTVEILLKEQLPADMRSAPESRDMLVECCNIFLDMLASQALAVCEEKKVTVMQPAHVVTALEVPAVVSIETLPIGPFPLSLPPLLITLLCSPVSDMAATGDARVCGSMLRRGSDLSHSSAGETGQEEI